MEFKNCSHNIYIISKIIPLWIPLCALAKFTELKENYEFLNFFPSFFFQNQKNSMGNTFLKQKFATSPPKRRGGGGYDETSPEEHVMTHV